MSKQIIKFRGKRIDNGEWVYGGYTLDLEGKPKIITVDTLLDGVRKCFNFHEVIPESVGQFTNYYDWYNKEIYDGDILSQREWMKPSVHVKYVEVFFDSADLQWGGIYPRVVPWQSIYLAGNKFDNRELLEVSDV